MLVALTVLQTAAWLEASGPWDVSDLTPCTPSLGSWGKGKPCTKKPLSRFGPLPHTAAKSFSADPHNPNETRGVTSVRDEKELARYRDVILTKDAEIKSLKMENAELRRNVTLDDAHETYTTHTSIAEEMGWCPCWYRQPGVGLPVSAGGRF